MRQLSLNRERDAVLTAIYRDRRAEALEEFLKSGAEAYVVAGALRDIIADREPTGGPRDFDITFTGLRREYFDEVLSAFGQKNRHAGYVLHSADAAQWDIWRLEESVGLKKTGAAPTLENMLRTFNLDCNAIALNLRTAMFIDGGAIDSLRKNQVDFVEHVLQHSHETFAAKAVLLNLRFGYRLSKPLNRFVNAYLDSHTLAYEARKVFPGLLELPFSTAKPS
jgi:hypothetical protein